MRTTTQRQRVLLREARAHLGVQTNADVWNRVATVSDQLSKGLPDLKPIIVGPYMNDSWGVYWVGPTLQEHWAPIPLDALLNADRIRNSMILPS